MEAFHPFFCPCRCRQHEYHIQEAICKDSQSRRKDLEYSVKRFKMSNLTDGRSVSVLGLFDACLRQTGCGSWIPGRDSLLELKAELTRIGINKKSLVSLVKIIDDGSLRKVGHIGHIFNQFVL